MSEDKVMFDEADEVSFADFYESIDDKLGSDEESIVVPDSRLAARDWLLAILKSEDEIDYYKKEYLPHLVSKYMDPVREKIAKLEKTKEFLRSGMREFLENAGEKSVTFPDLATVSKYGPPAKLIYPDDEKELLAVLEKEKSEFVRSELKIDKKKISSEFKKTGKPPIDALIVEESTPTVKITRVKKKD